MEFNNKVNYNAWGMKTSKTEWPFLKDFGDQKTYIYPNEFYFLKNGAECYFLGFLKDLKNCYV